ncbi:hypothetical protein H0E84_05400 [Luteimonas sp. SJ-92]|uniref:Uncharacterized protein n=1 Tax=Luteimonas salinisoli TaxID=2752307 RepID=A0A853J9H3_9GAMM|nr:hypothetical protein [Luteimonas salinisoli]NZA25811.1 hypothetical protein [Luteimonas salinisoli]
MTETLAESNGVRRIPTALAIAGLALACGACTPPEEPLPDKRPEPQATQLRDAIQAPQDRARAVEDTVREAEAERRREADSP